MSRSAPTFIGSIDSVKGSIISVRLDPDLPSTILLNGESYRLGQIGAFYRIPLGFLDLYAVCTRVGASPDSSEDAEEQHSEPASNFQRWMTLSIFGESLSGYFERGVAQFPTIGDDVHLVTSQDLDAIYSSTDRACTIDVGNISASSGIQGRLDLSKIVSRHCAVVGSTGSGKSNLVATMLNAIATQGYSNARILVIDPHGEYSGAVSGIGYTFKIGSDDDTVQNLVVPYWALPFEELVDISLGGMQPSPEAAIRDEIAERKKKAAKNLKSAVPEVAITADSPIPFDICQLWYDLDLYENETLRVKGDQSSAAMTDIGDPKLLIPRKFEPPGPGGSVPFTTPSRGLTRQLVLMRSRLADTRYDFLFNPGDDYSVDDEGKTKKDLAELVSGWIGHDRIASVLDLSEVPSDVLSTVVGTVLRIVYETLFWSGTLPTSGQSRPLLIFLEEAHLFLPDGQVSPAQRIISRIAKEGRKYGVGLVVVSQRPSEVDSTVLSQCGTMIALRLTHAGDRSKVASTIPDDLGDLTALLPALRTGEGLVTGEAMPIPSRIRFTHIPQKVLGSDPDLSTSWRSEDQPKPEHYEAAIVNWRKQSMN